MKLANDHRLQCRCGNLRGTLAAGAKFTRARCYCRDCQAYARALGEPQTVLDEKGGTDIVASLPRFVRFGSGNERLACLSLSERGLLRWYADCCRTPIANTPRDPKISYVGLVSACLGDPRALDAVFGPPVLAINSESATGPVPTSGFRIATATARIIGRVMGARMSGAWRENPFFDSDLRPVSRPRVLDASP